MADPFFQDNPAAQDWLHGVQSWKDHPWGKVPMYDPCSIYPDVKEQRLGDMDSILEIMFRGTPDLAAAYNKKLAKQIAAEEEKKKKKAEREAEKAAAAAEKLAKINGQMPVASWGTRPGYGGQPTTLADDIERQ